MTDDPDNVHRPDRDKHAADVERVLRDREAEATHMIARWERSPNWWAPDELAHWRAVLADVERKRRRYGVGQDPDGASG